MVKKDQTSREIFAEIKGGHIPIIIGRRTRGLAPVRIHHGIVLIIRLTSIQKCPSSYWQQCVGSQLLAKLRNQTTLIQVWQDMYDTWLWYLGVFTSRYVVGACNAAFDSHKRIRSAVFVGALVAGDGVVISGHLGALNCPMGFSEVGFAGAVVHTWDRPSQSDAVC